MKKIKQICLIITTISLPYLAFAEGDVQRGEERAFTCLGCHNNTGLKNAYPNYSVPKIAGQSQAYLIQSLKDYQNDQRVHPTMQGNASSISDQDIQDITAYFSSL